MKEIKEVIFFVLVAVSLALVICWPLIVFERNAKDRRAQMYIDGAIKITEMIINGVNEK